MIKFMLSLPTITERCSVVLREMLLQWEELMEVDFTLPFSLVCELTKPYLHSPGPRKEINRSITAYILSVYFA